MSDVEHLAKLKMERHLKILSLFNPYIILPEWKLSQTEETIFKLLREDSCVTAESLSEVFNVIMPPRKRLQAETIRQTFSTLRRKLQTADTPFRVSPSKPGFGVYLIVQKEYRDVFSQRV